MNSRAGGLSDLLRRARSRRQLLLVLRGVAICLFVLAAVLLLTGWAAHHYRHYSGTLTELRLGALAMLLATIYLTLLRPVLQRISDTKLARLIEERSSGTENRLITAVEVS